jgi:hypothetical protein
MNAAESARPCQCHQSFAYISPIHSGHCCFIPETQTCHPDEVAEWERRASENDPARARSIARWYAERQGAA